MNSLRIVPASPGKRALSYLIDFLIIATPTAIVLWLTVKHLFAPSPLVGWLTLSAIALITLVYTVVLAAQNSSTGQTAGKRLTGIRTLRAESLKPSDFPDAYARGFSFFLGLLGLAIAPLRMLAQNRHQAEAESWPHKSGNTRVIDIRLGKDPLSIDKKFYPLYPEEWGSTTSPAAPTYPPQVSPGSAAWQPSSTDSAPLTEPRITASQHYEEIKKKRQLEKIKTAFTVLLTLLITAALPTAVLVAAMELNPEMPKPRDEHEVLASSLTGKLPVTGYSGHGFPGYAATPNWEYEVSSQAKIFSTAKNIYSFENRELTVLSVDTGKETATFPLEKTVDVSAQTVYNSNPGIYWSTGNTAYGWYSSGAPEKPFSDTIPDGAQPYAAGSELLFAAHNESNDQFKAWQFTDKGFQELKVPSGFIPGSIDAGKLLSYTAAGDIKVSDKNGQEISAYPLLPPKEGLPFAGVISTGNQRVVALWSPYPDSTAEATPVFISTYDATSGNLLSYIETTRERTNTHPELIWSPNGATAMYAGYLFDVTTGKPTTDLIAQDIKPISLIGSGALGESTLGSVYVTGAAVYSIAGVTPLLADNNMAVVRTHSNTLEKYSK